jgi:hypothetical protein
MTKIVDATDMDFVRFFKMPAPTGEWYAKVQKDGKLVKAIAGIIKADDGRYFGFMDLKGSARYPLIFRVFKRFIENLPQTHGITKLFVTCDESYLRSEAFLARLGFVETDEVIEDNKVWMWQH